MYISSKIHIAYFVVVQIQYWVSSQTIAVYLHPNQTMKTSASHRRPPIAMSTNACTIRWNCVRLRQHHHRKPVTKSARAHYVPQDNDIHILC